MLSFYGETVDGLDEDYSALRIVAETSWLEEDATTVEQFMAYESRINDLFAGTDCLALCQYDRTRFDPDIVRTIVQTHPHLIYDGTVCHNFYYTPPEEFFGADEPDCEVDRMLGTLRDRTEAKASLRRRKKFLQDLYDITSATDHRFDEKLQALFDLGCEWFGMDGGGLARIDPETDSFEVEAVSSQLDAFAPGDELPLSETYCRVTARTSVDGCLSEPVVVDDPADNGFETAACVTDLGLEAYLGARLPIQGADDRTFFFVSEQSCLDPVSEEERTFHRLMSQWVTHGLERRERERFLRESYQITSDPDRAFEEKLEDLLALGIDWMGLDVGGLTHLPARGGEFLNEYVVADEDLRGTWTDPDEGCFCRKVMATDGPVGQADVRGTAWEDDDIYREYGLASYLGTRVCVGSTLYGTLWLGSRQPRERPFSEVERTFIDLIEQWVSYELEHSHRETRLESLNAVGSELLDAETAQEVASGVIDTLTDTLDSPVATVALYDECSGQLRPVAETPVAETLLDAETLLGRSDSPGWSAFIDGERRQVTGPFPESLPENTVPSLTAVTIYPLGTHGIYVVGSQSVDEFGRGEHGVSEAVTANIRAALDRTDREQKLQERESALEERNRTLTRLNRINDTIRNIDQALVEASTRDEIHRVVCEELADSGPYELAWVGKRDGIDGEVLPVESAGAAGGYLDDITVTTDDSKTSRGPAGRAVRTGEPQVVNNILTDQSFEPWREDALGHGFQATAAFPLQYDGTQYGVLNLYAGQPQVFDELERQVLAELANTVGHAINAIESKKALLSDEVIELEFSVTDESLPVVEMTRTLDCEFSLKRVLQRSADEVRAFFATQGVAAEEVLDFESRLPVSDMALVSESTDGSTGVFEAVLESDSIPTTVLEHGGQVRALETDDGAAEVTVHLAGDAAVREFVGMFQSKYPDSDLTAQRTRDVPQQTVLECTEMLTDGLTDRQQEAIQTAYFNGYFEEPRSRTGAEIAESMDISQPTFNSHVRAAMRKLCRGLFEDAFPST